MSTSTIFFPGGESGPELAARARVLADDLARISIKGRPSEADLVDAPVMFDPRFGVGFATVLVGHVGGHPLLSGPTIKTSEVFAMDLRAGWARTWSRFYRLAGPVSGRPS